MSTNKPENCVHAWSEDRVGGIDADGFPHYAIVYECRKCGMVYRGRTTDDYDPLSQAYTRDEQEFLPPNMGTGRSSPSGCAPNLIMILLIFSILLLALPAMAIYL
jgi:hypothetical protein